MQKITGAASSLGGAVPSNPVNMGDIAKSAQSLMPIAGINPNQITAGLAGLSKLVDQPSSVVSNIKGVGQFGLDANQLQTAGFLKPGTTDLLAAGKNTLTDVLKSPTVWTGKEGVTNLKSLLGSVSAQSKIQQTLMSNGAASLSTLGINVSALSPSAATGTLLNAAKSVPGAAAWAKGIPVPQIPGGLPALPGIPPSLPNVPSLPGVPKVPSVASLTAGMDATAIAGSFGVKLSNLKANPPVLQETKPEGAVDTVNRATVNAAASRVVGDPKVPKLDYGGGDVDVTVFDEDAKNYIENIVGPGNEILDQIENQLNELITQPSITQAQYDSVKALYDKGRDLFNVTGQALLTKLDAQWNKLPSALKKPRNELVEKINKIRRDLVSRAIFVNDALKELKAKISG